MSLVSKSWEAAQLYTRHVHHMPDPCQTFSAQSTEQKIRFEPHHASQLTTEFNRTATGKCPCSRTPSQSIDLYKFARRHRRHLDSLE